MAEVLSQDKIDQLLSAINTEPYKSFSIEEFIDGSNVAKGDVLYGAWRKDAA